VLPFIHSFIPSLLHLHPPTITAVASLTSVVALDTARPLTHMATLSLLTSVLLVCVIVLTTTTGSWSQSSSTFDIRNHLNTKTPYWEQRPPTRPAPPPSGCRVVNVNLIARHGTREPTSKDISRLNALAAKCHQYARYITNPAFAWMKTWQNPVGTLCRPITPTYRPICTPDW
jgi:hypothetical protein